jgi:prolyl 4-hydroxylase
MRALSHTSTFGARIYHRNSMLIDHVDRADTHLASAVLQIDQDLEDGWPLEVIGSDGEYYEVYLQPYEMVLYEGARLFHGRPMRFNGTDFANIFSHFAPKGYKGPYTNKHGRSYVAQGPVIYAP